MNLRSRLLLGSAVLLIALAVAMSLVARSQHRFLLDQLDRRLLAASPIVNGPRPPIATDTSSAPIGATDENSLLSELYLGSFDDDGTLRSIVAGALVDGTPDVTLQQAQTSNEPFTTGAASGRTQFRVLTLQEPGGEYVVLAISLDEVEAAQSRLVLTLAIALAVVVVVLSLTTWWMVRLGLRPINQMTTTAEAIARGERGHRVQFDDTTTETGRLGRAFNTMLDERDLAEQRLRTFVADASHELRTPLTSVRGYLDLALEGDLPPQRLTESLRRARKESRRMGDLVDDLFLLAQLDEGRALEYAPVDLEVVVVDAASDARAIQPSRRIEVVNECHESGAVVQGDQYRLRQVVASLVHNALVHTPTDVVIRLTTRPSTETVLIEVADNGPGLPAGFEHSVFDRFSRGESSRTRQAGGAGLGLAIARSIVEAHHGTITVSAPTSAGCTFNILLPRRHPNTAPLPPT